MNKLINSIDAKSIIKNIPKDDWVCNKCGSVNNNWRPNLLWLSDRAQKQYVKSICPVCEKVKLRKDIDRQLGIEQLNKKLTIKKLIKLSNIPPKIRDITFDKLKIIPGNECINVLKKIDKIKSWVYLSGKNSTGKTHLIGACLNHLISKNIPCTYFNEVFLLERIKNTYNKNGEKKKNIFDLIYNSQYIFWDEFSYNKYTTHNAEIMYQILEFAETYNRIIVFASNLNLKQLILDNRQFIIDRLTGRIFARLERNKILYYNFYNNKFKNY